MLVTSRIATYTKTIRRFKYNFRVLVVSDNVVGNELRSLSLAQKLTGDIKANQQIHHIKSLPIVDWLPNFLKPFLVNAYHNLAKNRFSLPLYLTSSKSDKEVNVDLSEVALNPPDFVIGCGRSTVYPMLTLRLLSRKPFFIQIEHPYLPYKNFDSVVLQKQELLKLAHLGPVLSQQKNTVITQLALNQITERNLILNQTSPILNRNLYKPEPNGITLAVLLGNVDITNFTFLNSHCEKLTESLELLVKTFKAKVLVSYSERAPKLFIELIDKKVASLSEQGYKIFSPRQHHSSNWTREASYQYYLTVLDVSTHIAVLAGSHHLVSEAIATRKPVYLIGTDQCRKETFTFKQRLIKNNWVRPFHVSKQYVSPGDPLSYLGRHPFFEPVSKDFVDTELKQVVEKVLELRTKRDEDLKLKK